MWVKMTAPYRLSGRARMPYDDVEPLVGRLCATRPDRLLWGSDWPHPINPKPIENDGDLLSEIFDWLAPDLRRHVFVENPALLYGFE